MIPDTTCHPLFNLPSVVQPTCGERWQDPAVAIGVSAKGFVPHGEEPFPRHLPVPATDATSATTVPVIVVDGIVEFCSGGDGGGGSDGDDEAAPGVQAERMLRRMHHGGPPGAADAGVGAVNARGGVVVKADELARCDWPVHSGGHCAVVNYSLESVCVCVNVLP